MSEDTTAQPQDTTAPAGAAADAAPAAEPASALEAIDKALGYDEQAGGEGAAGEDAAPGADEQQAGKEQAPAEAARPADKPTTPTAKPADKVADKGADDAAADARSREKHGDMLEVPQGLKAATAQRIQTLIGTIKRQDRELETMTAAQAQTREHAEIVQGYNQIFEESRCQPAQFQIAMDFIGAVNRQDWTTAERVLTQQIRMLSLATGREFGTPDPLSDFPDLAQEVAQQQISTARALEIARARVAAATRQQADERARAQSTQQAEWQRATAAGAQAVNVWTAEMAAKDIDWPVKEKLLEAEIDRLAAEVHPSQWLASLQTYYRLISAGKPASAPTAGAGSRPQPLRAAAGAGAARAVPKSLAEAIDQGLGYAAAA